MQEGQVCSDLVDLRDVLPTLAELAGAELPAEIKFDGRSFAPQLHGKQGNPRQWIYCWYHRNGVRNQASQHVRDQKYKLYSDGRMFDVADDFYEQSPLKFDELEGVAREKYELFSNVLEEKQREAKAVK